MHKMALGFFAGLSLVATAQPAPCATEMARYIGYTILAEKTIAGSISKDGEKKTSFEGCDYGRIIYFDDNTYLKCATYAYKYAFRPDALILVKGSSFVMIVDGDAFEMTN